MRKPTNKIIIEHRVSDKLAGKGVGKKLKP